MPAGYLSAEKYETGFQPPGQFGEICYRDVTSPIDPSDHRLDSSGGGKGRYTSMENRGVTIGVGGERCFWDVTSPIDPSDHRLDSSGGGKGRYTRMMLENRGMRL